MLVGSLAYACALQCMSVLDRCHKTLLCDFYSQVNSIQAHAEEEMKKMSNKWRKKETKMIKDNEAEKEKVRSEK